MVSGPKRRSLGRDYSQSDIVCAGRGAEIYKMLIGSRDEWGYVVSDYVVSGSAVLRTAEGQVHVGVADHWFDGVAGSSLKIQGHPCVIKAYCRLDGLIALAEREKRRVG
jgi:hypothetical protein